MADYSCSIRTNYFRVKDEDKFRQIMSRVYGEYGTVTLWDQTDSKGNTKFGFGTYGSIRGWYENDSSFEEEGVLAYDDFIHKLQECVADDDAIIILESGGENLRYLTGTADIITSDGYDYINIIDLAISRAREMSPKLKYWETECTC